MSVVYFIVMAVYMYILGAKFQTHGSWHGKGNQIVKVTNDDFRVLDYVTVPQAIGLWS